MWNRDITPMRMRSILPGGRALRIIGVNLLRFIGVADGRVSYNVRAFGGGRRWPGLPQLGNQATRD